LLRLKACLLVLAAFCSFQYTVRDAGSCSVPVFRYALERWKPDPYKGIFIYRDAIAAPQQSLLRQLEEAALNPEYPLNLRIRKVNADSFPEEKLRELLKGPIPEKLPVLAIWYPEQMGKSAPLWMLDPAQSALQALIESPKRTELAESLISGASVVWIFVPSGNAQKDAQAKAFIRKQLDAALSELSKMPFFILAGAREKKLNYGFPILTVSRTDPGERFFLDMLLHSESDLHEYAEEPMVFPVFGRGRLLGCLFGKFITEKNIQGAISFLSGACSCEVKALNPGVDLLLPAFWDRVILGDLFVQDDTPLPELTGVMPGPPVSERQGTLVSEKQETPVSERQEIPVPERQETLPLPEKPESHPNLLAISGITIGSVFVIVVFAGLILNHRRKENL
jgi:hypothetical protein